MVATLTETLAGVYGHNGTVTGRDHYSIVTDVAKRSAESELMLRKTLIMISNSTDDGDRGEAGDESRESESSKGLQMPETPVFLWSLFFLGVTRESTANAFDSMQRSVQGCLVLT